MNKQQIVTLMARLKYALIQLRTVDIFPSSEKEYRNAAQDAIAKAYQDLEIEKEKMEKQ